jgi:hypothetical protein
MIVTNVPMMIVILILVAQLLKSSVIPMITVSLTYVMPLLDVILPQETVPTIIYAHMTLVQKGNV